MIIDFHAHIFPDKIAEKATFYVGDFYGLTADQGGRLCDLLDAGEKAGIDKHVIHSVATVPDQVVSINNFIANTVKDYPEKLIGFATIHPDYPDIKGEIERAVSIGLKGVKIHPDFQQFDIDGQKAMPIYEAIVEIGKAGGKLGNGLPILVHTGDFRYNYSKPFRVANVLKKFPKLIFIGAHFGGWSEWDDAIEILTQANKFDNLYVDTSSTLYEITPQKAMELIKAFGADRVLFGTDYPMWDLRQEMVRFNNLSISQEERDLILYQNAVRVLGG